MYFPNNYAIITIGDKSMEKEGRGYLRIINHYGPRHQLKKLSEEVYELIESIMDYEYQRDACENIGCDNAHIDKEYEHMCEEYADVWVLLEQIKVYYELSDAKIVANMVSKVKRQFDRMGIE